jgi:hypothetical protein
MESPLDALRNHSLIEIEEAIAGAISKLTGKPFAATVSKLLLDDDFLNPHARFRLTLRAESPMFAPDPGKAETPK